MWTIQFFLVYVTYMRDNTCKENGVLLADFLIRRGGLNYASTKSNTFEREVMRYPVRLC